MYARFDAVATGVSRKDTPIPVSAHAMNGQLAMCAQAYLPYSADIYITKAQAMEFFGLIDPNSIPVQDFDLL